VNDSNRRSERKVEDPEAFVAQIKAEAAAERERRLVDAPPIKRDFLLVGTPNQMPKLETGVKIAPPADGTKPKKQPKPGPGLALKDVPEKGGDADAEALSSEAPVAVTDLGPEEEKRRRIVRWRKLQEINRKCAVVREYGGKCVIATEGRSAINSNRRIFVYQSKDAFEQWTANDFIPSLEKKNKTPMKLKPEIAGSRSK
jgi:hypothetical protein